MKRNNPHFGLGQNWGCFFQFLTYVRISFRGDGPLPGLRHLTNRKFLSFLLSFFLGVGRPKPISFFLGNEGVLKVEDTEQKVTLHNVPFLATYHLYPGNLYLMTAQPFE